LRPENEAPKAKSSQLAPVGDDKLEAKFVLGLPIRADDEVGESGTGEWIFDPTHLVKDPPTSMFSTPKKPLSNFQTFKLRYTHTHTQQQQLHPGELS
jgi:hypothetical protein